MFFGLLLMRGFISCGYVCLSCLLCWLVGLSYEVGCRWYFALHIVFTLLGFVTVDYFDVLVIVFVTLTFWGFEWWNSLATLIVWNVCIFAWAFWLCYLLLFACVVLLVDWALLVFFGWRFSCNTRVIDTWFTLFVVVWKLFSGLIVDGLPYNLLLCNLSGLVSHW